MPASSSLTPLGALGRGLAAGVIGTTVFDAFLYGQYRRGGGESSLTDWEFSKGLESWDDAPAPAQVGKRLIEGAFQIELAPEHAKLVNNITHWGYGLLGAMQYGVVVGSLRGVPRILYGLPFGACFWSSGYIVLPAMKLYKPIWEYDARVLAKDLSAHLVYGLATATAFRLLSR
jgi:hypothetical protein